MNNKKTIITAVLVAVLGVGTCFARPGGGHGRGHAPAPRHHGGGFRGGHRHAPPPRHHGGSVWGRGGRNFLPGFLGGAVAGAIASTIVRPDPVVVTPAPVVVTPTPVVTTPIYTTRTVWVEGRYVEQVTPQGTIIRTWQPGHYEQM